MSAGIEDFINQVIQGDCLEVMKYLPDNCIDMILCDLPYGTTVNPWDELIDLPELWRQYKRIIKPNGVIALTAHGLFTGRLIMSNPDWYRYKMVWIKSKAPNFLQAKIQPLKKHEDVLVFYQRKPIYQPQMTMGKPYDRGFRKASATGCYGAYQPNNRKSDGERYPIDVLFVEDEHDDWCYFKTAESEGKSVHPSQKPVELGRYLIRTYTEPGGIILDNACGSGSFLVAAVRERRRFIGIEKNAQAFHLKTQPVDFIAVCRERIQTEYEQIA